MAQPTRMLHYAHTALPNIYIKQPREPQADEPYPSHRMYACRECGFFFSNAPKSQVVLTDGACSNNGQPNAAAGCGVAMGDKQSQQLSMPFGGMNGAAPKTNQRAELLAAYAALVEVAQLYVKEQDNQAEHSHDIDRLVIATDSDYLVRGMKEWLPIWKKNGFKTPSGTSPTNLDLFLRIESQIEKMPDVSVDFAHIPRSQNGLADGLAKTAAEMDARMARIMP